MNCRHQGLSGTHRAAGKTGSPDTQKLNSSTKSLLHFLFYFFCKNYQQHCEEILTLGRRKCQSNQQVTRTLAFPSTLQGSVKVCRAPSCSWQNVKMFCTSNLAVIHGSDQDISVWPHGTALQTSCICESISLMDAQVNKEHGTSPSSCT